MDSFPSIQPEDSASRAPLPDAVRHAVLSIEGGAEITFREHPGGFSGAVLWRVDGAVPLCVRRWPSGTEVTRVQTVHQHLGWLVRADLPFIAAPLPVFDTPTWTEDRGHFWEVSRWLPGRADFHANPTRQRLEQVMLALAQVHQVWRSVGIGSRSTVPGMIRRWNALQQLREGEWSRIQREVSALGNAPPMVHRILALAQPLLPRLEADLRFALSWELWTHPCLRDIWHDHVLFQHDQFTGIVDYDAVDRDHVAADLARLLGSLLGDPIQDWTWALEIYQRFVPLDPREIQLVAIFDRANVVLAGLHWLRWLYVERRAFSELSRVQARMAEQLRRLEALHAAWQWTS